MGWVVLPKGVLVPIVVGSIVIFSLILASRALMNKMNGLWTFAFIFDLALSVLIALPLLLNVITDISAFTIELGEYLSISGVWVALLIFAMFTLPTFYACFYSGKNVLRRMQTSRSAL